MDKCETGSSFDKVYSEKTPKSLTFGTAFDSGGLRGQACESEYLNPRTIVDRLIDYHNRQSVQLHALLRALPAEMSREAERALYDLAKTALGSIR